MTISKTQLQTYADLLIKVGLNLQAGQRLVVAADIQTADFVHMVAHSAYQARARYVDVLWSDERLTLIRYQQAPRDSFEIYPTWVTQTLLEHAQRGDALLRIYAEDPVLLKDQDPELVTIALKSAARHKKPFSELQSRDALNWTVASISLPAWASRVFPDENPECATERLWEAIFQVCRLNEPDPVAAWKTHIDNLISRKQYLNQKKYQRIEYRAPGTNLQVGLPQNHIWRGGRGCTTTGIPFTPNIPTEEIFTLPHREQINGVVTASLPLSLHGTMIEDFFLTFEGGRVINLHAARGEATLRKLVETDQGSASLGEVALVPHSSPISQSGLIFYNTLFDENAACHLALGRAYRTCLEGGAQLSTEEFLAAGGNNSLIHEDFMIGSQELDIDGVTWDGAVEPLMRAGEWAFDIM